MLSLHGSAHPSELLAHGLLAITKPQPHTYRNSADVQDVPRSMGQDDIRVIATSVHGSRADISSASCRQLGRNLCGGGFVGPAAAPEPCIRSNCFQSLCRVKLSRLP